MSMLVKLADANKTNGDLASDSEKSSSQAGLSLREEEVFGNLFIVVAAGFETTANTMAYAQALLCTHPEWQEWLYEEIKVVLEGKDLDNLEYNEVYFKLPRCLALMVSP